MMKKSLSWFLAVIMAFTVFGGQFLLADTSHAVNNVEGKYGVYVETTNDDGTTTYENLPTERESWIVGKTKPVTLVLIKANDSDKFVDDNKGLAGEIVTGCQWMKNPTDETLNPGEYSADDAISVSTNAGKATVTFTGPGSAILVPYTTSGVNTSYYTDGNGSYCSAEFEEVVDVQLCEVGKYTRSDIKGSVTADMVGNYNFSDLTPIGDEMSLSLGSKDKNTKMLVLGYCSYNGGEYSVFDSSKTVTLKTGLNTKYAKIDTKPTDDELGNNTLTVVKISAYKAGTENINIKATVDDMGFDEFTPEVTVSDAEYYICRTALNPLSIISTGGAYTYDSNTGELVWKPTDGSGNTYPHNINIDLVKLLKNPVFFQHVKKIQDKEFMDVFSNGIGGYIGLSMDFNGMCYAVCERTGTDGKLVPVTDVKSIDWSSDNMSVITLGDELRNIVGDENYKEIMATLSEVAGDADVIELIEKILSSTSYSTYQFTNLSETITAAIYSALGSYGSYIDNTTVTAILLALNSYYGTDQDVFTDVNSLTKAMDSMVIALGAKEGKGTLKATATTESGDTIVSEVVPTSINAAGKIENVEFESVHNGKATVKWDPIAEKVQTLTKDTEYYVYLQKYDGAVNEEENNYEYTAIARSLFNQVTATILKIANQALDIAGISEYVEDFLDIDLEDNSTDYGWEDMKTVSGATTTTFNVEPGCSYRVVVLGFQGKGNQYNILNGQVQYYDKASCIYGEDTITIDSDTISLDNAVVTLDPDFDSAEKAATYNGKDQTPAVTVKCNGAELVKDTDYTLTAGPCTNAGTYAVTVTAKEGSGYTGEVTKEFKINALDFAKATVSLSQNVYKYDGTEKKPEVTVKDAAGNVIPAEDYEVAYDSDVKSIGQHTVTVTAKTDNVTGEAVANYSINEELTVDGCDITLDQTEFTYEDDYNEPEVTKVTNGDALLILDKDYTVSYEENTKNVGTYKVTVTGKGEYKGSNTASYVVNPAKVTVKLTAGKKKITVKWGKKSQVDKYIIKYSTSRDAIDEGTAKSKTVSKDTAKKVIKGLKAKKKYYVQVVTKKTVDGQNYYNYSAVKSIKTKK